LKEVRKEAEKKGGKTFLANILLFSDSPRCAKAL
jgi:hypothetical protein